MATTKQANSEEIDSSFTCYQAVKEAKADVRDNIQIVNSLSDSMNNLSSSLERLDNLMESLLFGEEKEKEK